MGPWGLPPPPLFKRRRHDRETWMTYIYTYVGLGQFLGFKILNFNILGGFQKKVNIFWGMKIVWIFFGVITKLGYI